MTISGCSVISSYVHLTIYNINKHNHVVLSNTLAHIPSRINTFSIQWCYTPIPLPPTWTTTPTHNRCMVMTSLLKHSLSQFCPSENGLKCIFIILVALRRRTSWMRWVSCECGEGCNLSAVKRCCLYCHLVLAQLLAMLDALSSHLISSLCLWLWSHMGSCSTRVSMATIHQDSAATENRIWPNV